MWAATFEATYGTYLRMVHQKTYDAILATPLTLDDVVAGDALWAASKGMANGLIMLGVVAGFGLARTYGEQVRRARTCLPSPGASLDGHVRLPIQER
jgi:hypothetical protein